jgi:hypothetical protein
VRCCSEASPMISVPPNCIPVAAGRSGLRFQYNRDEIGFLPAIESFHLIPIRNPGQGASGSGHL